MRALDTRKALVPDPLPPVSELRSKAWATGILVVVALVAIIGVSVGRSSLPLLLAVPGALVLYARGRYRILLWQVRRWAQHNGKLGILITSKSPHWEQYIEQVWLP